MALCASCYAPAVVKFDARGVRERRAITACQWCAPAAERWTATAGPVTRTDLTPDETAPELATLF